MFGQYGIRDILIAFLIGIIVGAYGITHLGEVLNGLSTFRSWAVRSYHHEVICTPEIHCTYASPSPTSL